MDLVEQCPPRYPAGARLVVVADSPDAEEVRQREPFVGRAGQVLNRILQVGGINFDDVGRTHLCKRTPNGGVEPEHFVQDFYTHSTEGRRKVSAPTGELGQWTARLAHELKVTGCNVAMACGGETLRALCGVTGIPSYRGSVLPSTLVPGLWVVPAVHPGWIVRSAQWQEPYVAGHIVAHKIRPILVGSWKGYHTWQEEFAPTIERACAFLNECARARDPYFSLDIETRAGSIACVGVGFRSEMGDKAMCVPLQTTRGPYFSPEHEHYFWKQLDNLLKCKTIVGHNVAYDLDWLWDYGVQASDIDDTMLFFHRQHAELPKGLDFCAMWLTDIPYYKQDGKTWGRNQPDEKLWSYNLKDVIATLRIWRHFCEHDYLTASVYREYTKAVWPIAFEMQLRGMPVDETMVDIARGVVQAELDKVVGRLSELSGGELAVKPGNSKVSDAQVKAYIYGKLGLPPKRNRKTKALTADEDAIVELLIQRPDLDVLKAMLAERKFHKALNSYIDIPLKETEL